VTRHGVWIGNRIYWSLHTARDYTLHNTVTHRQMFQSLSSLYYWVTSSSSGRSSAPRLTSSETVGHLTPTSQSSNSLRLKSESKSYYYLWSVGQSVLVSIPIWGLRPNLCYCQTVAVLLMWGTPLTRGLVCHLLLVVASTSHSGVRVPRDS
jgi:hypothetical protein